MGKLKPNVTYIYEKADGVTYARESGAPISERFEIGRDYNKQLQEEYNLWKKIVDESRANPVLHDAMEKCKIIYHLSKKDKPIFWHPV